MVAGVHLDLGPKKRMQSMDDPTDAEMAKEGRGLMMCIVFRVSQQRTNSGSTINLSFFYVVSKKNGLKYVFKSYPSKKVVTLKLLT